MFSEIRLFIAEWLLGAAFSLMPKGSDERKRFAIALRYYLTGTTVNLHIDGRQVADAMIDSLKRAMEPTP